MTVQTYGFKDLRMSLVATASGSGAPSLVAFGPTGLIKQLRFNVNDSVYVAGHIDHDVIVGATTYPHVHWSTDGTNVQPVKWQMTYTIAPGHDIGNFPADTVISVEEAAAGTAWRHMVTEHPTGFAMPDIDSLFIAELKRVTNGGTDNTDNVYGLFMDLHYEVGQFATPNRLPPFYTP